MRRVLGAAMLGLACMGSLRVLAPEDAIRICVENRTHRDATVEARTSAGAVVWRQRGVTALGREVCSKPLPSPEKPLILWYRWQADARDRWHASEEQLVTGGNDMVVRLDRLVAWVMVR